MPSGVMDMVRPGDLACNALRDPTVDTHALSVGHDMDLGRTSLCLSHVLLCAKLRAPFDDPSLAQPPHFASALCFPLYQYCPVPALIDVPLADPSCSQTPMAALIYVTHPVRACTPIPPPVSILPPGPDPASTRTHIHTPQSGLVPVHAYFLPQSTFSRPVQPCARAVDPHLYLLLWKLLDAGVQQTERTRARLWQDSNPSSAFVNYKMLLATFTVLNSTTRTNSNALLQQVTLISLLGQNESKGWVAGHTVFCMTPSSRLMQCPIAKMFIMIAREHIPSYRHSYFSQTDQSPVYLCTTSSPCSGF
ncbi:hypothetical protein RSOL_180320 [Rhizoctonia solani AG-3 Rhs1AP]|uniref:Uncharacterized protein n=2 Tax=Rhizoctonia solani AG-3 TaxID=1086053 RepID=A0A074RGB5_9AGAM|nr:hypothetical protein RSOL_180320 [Rhizoctonia solani AG-3 Rhs1AP]KEP45789.1 hypothetical protein V565_241420 [Rhizoctonia solani 123E]